MYQSITSFAITTGFDDELEADDPEIDEDNDEGFEDEEAVDDGCEPFGAEPRRGAEQADDRDDRERIRDPLAAAARVLLQQLARVAERARVAQRQRPERTIGVDEVRIELFIEPRMVLEVDPALHEVGRHVGKHAEHAHHSVEP